MIKKMIRQMIAAQTLSALTVSLCLLIDNIMIGQFLGVQALAAYGLSNPVLLVIGALGSMLCAGVQVALSKSLGKGNQEETNIGYSSAIAVAAGISLFFILLVVFLRVPLAKVMGAGTPELITETGNYMTGFIIGAPASMGALILVPFLQMAGKSNLLIAAVLGMTVADVGFDLLNAVVFHGGMFGMGLASSLSYYVAMAIGGWYFFSKKSVFHFSFSRVRWTKIRELLMDGVPVVIGMAASVVLVFVLNRMLLVTGGPLAVAAFSVVNTIGSASNCISTGSGGVALTLSGILYNEEDRTGLTQMLQVMIRYAAVLGIAVTALLFLLAPSCVSLFLPEPGQSRDFAIFGLRAFSLGLTPCCINNALRSSYQGTARVGTMELISALENGILPILAALILSGICGVDGVWFYFVSGEVLSLLGILAYVWRKNRKVTLKSQDILLLSEELGVSGEDLLEQDVSDMVELMEFVYRAEDFCVLQENAQKLGRQLALCIEEMGSNILTHGFDHSGKNHLFIRLQHKENQWVLRFRDDCRAFNPLDHVLIQDGQDNLGIRLTMHMADEARYTYSLNLNNLILIFRNPEPSDAGAF